MDLLLLNLTYQSTGVNLEKHPVDVQKEIIATFNATVDDAPGVSSGTWMPLVCIKHIKDIIVHLDDIFWTLDKFGILVACWMDNGMAFSVSTVHDKAAG